MTVTKIGVSKNWIGFDSNRFGKDFGAYKNKQQNFIIQRMKTTNQIDDEREKEDEETGSTLMLPKTISDGIRVNKEGGRKEHTRENVCVCAFEKSSLTLRNRLNSIDLFVH